MMLTSVLPDLIYDQKKKMFLNYIMEHTDIPSLLPGAIVGTAVVTSSSMTWIWNTWSLRILGWLAVSETWN